MSKFSFGKNWIRFVKHALNENSIKTAQASLLNNIPQSELKDCIFVDIGCGSGLFSLAALKIVGGGGENTQVISVDIDTNSILASKMTKDKFAPNASGWEILQGSILDDSFCAKLKDKIAGKKAIVYSWGVLHHTGDLNKALKNAASLASAKDSLLFISIYNKTKASDFWSKIKHFYNKTNIVMKFLMVCFYTAFLTFEDIRKGRGLNMRDKARGMHKVTDVIDWLGGLPYEPAKAEYIDKKVKECGLSLIKFNPTKYHEPTYPKGKLKRMFVYLKVVGLGCNEYLFRRV